MKIFIVIFIMCVIPSFFIGEYNGFRYRVVETVFYHQLGAIATGANLTNIAKVKYPSSVEKLDAKYGIFGSMYGKADYWLDHPGMVSEDFAIGLIAIVMFFITNSFSVFLSLWIPISASVMVSIGRKRHVPVRFRLAGIVISLTYPWLMIAHPESNFFIEFAERISMSEDQMPMFF